MVLQGVRRHGERDGRLRLRPVQLFIEEHSEVSGPTQEPARVILNLDVEDCRALEAHLEQVGATWVRPVAAESFGLIGTLADPDGNYVQIIQWGASPESHRD